MDAVDWTALSVLVTIFVAVVLGAFGYLSRQISRFEDRVAARFDQVDARIDGVEARLGARIDRLEERYIRFLETR